MDGDKRKMDNLEWIPIAEYAVKTGTSISTLRRKIKSNAIPYRLEEGRYLVEYGLNEKQPAKEVFPRKSEDSSTKAKVVQAPFEVEAESSADLRWKALEVRVAGLVKKVELLSEQTSELRMLVKIFEERLNASQ